MSTAFAGTGAKAHEVVPSIADLSTNGARVELSIRLNLEALVAGIDLDDLEDTDAAEQTGSYQSLRGLGADALAAKAAMVVARWNAAEVLKGQSGAITLDLVGVDVPDVPDLDLPRLSVLRMSGVMAPADASLRVAWPKGAGALVLRQQGVDDPFTAYLAGGETSAEIAVAGGGAATGWQAFTSYIPVGFDHILPKGLDHILFVLGLFFLSVAWRPLLMQISAFTLAHTVTLALGALGWVAVPGHIVEPLIAASIVYVAVENLMSNRLSRRRPYIVFGFGLLHGLGFASVLGEFGLPADQFIPALLGFNIGVELGQITVISIAFMVIGWAGARAWFRPFVSVPASMVIAAIGAYWCVERVFF